MSHRRKAPSGPIPAKLKAALAAKKGISKESTKTENQDPIIYPMTQSNLNAFEGTAKEIDLLNQAIKIMNTDAKQTKKILKLVDTNLKKNGVHFNSLLLKALVNQKNDNVLEAKANFQKALSKVPGSTKNNLNLNIITAMSCQLISSYYKECEDYENNYVWLKRAYMKSGGHQNMGNSMMLNQLCLLAAQLRKYPELLEFREHYLAAKPGFRANWTGFALALDLNNNTKSAVEKLSQFEEAAEGKITEKEAFENGECIFYKNDLMLKLAKNDETKLHEVLKNLEEKKKHLNDKLGYLERKAEIYVRLGDMTNATKVYRKLIHRNPDNFKYFKMLEITLGIKDDNALKYKMYSNLLKKYPLSEPCRFMPLTFIEEDSELKAYLKFYLDLYWAKGVFASFQLLKPLFRNLKLSMKFQKLAEEICLQRLKSLQENVKNDTQSKSKLESIIRYFLSNLYLFQRNYDAALNEIQQCQYLDAESKVLEFELFQARILKHMNEFKKACELMEIARQKDNKDRFLNNKSCKYHLRANDINKAVELISMFTKNDTSYCDTGITDLHSVQNTWFLSEQAEAYSRLFEIELNKLKTSEDETERIKIAKCALQYKNLAVKRFEAVFRIYGIYKNDQHDFNSYALRRGTVQPLMHLIKWVDKIHTLPVYRRILKGMTTLVKKVPEFHQIVDTFKSPEKVFLINHSPKEIKQVAVSAPEVDDDPFGHKYDTLKNLKKIADVLIRPYFEKYDMEVSKRNRDYVLSLVINKWLENGDETQNKLLNNYEEILNKVHENGSLNFENLSFNDDLLSSMKRYLKDELTKDGFNGDNINNVLIKGLIAFI
ncbi:hypothetical protein ACO0R3_000037 [Hanseniaspora guilliermondii]